jgi:hypothetical protein
MSEVKRGPIITQDVNGDDLATFDASHTWADVARWVMSHSEADAEELHRILGEMISGRDGEMLQ